MRTWSDRAILLAMAADAPAIDADALARIARRFPDWCAGSTSLPS
jgi:CTP:molybdopterin cytidylyltransferase MocA